MDDLTDFWRKLHQEDVHEGMLVIGRVERIEEHGVYIDLNMLEAEGYCPVKELSNRRVTTPKDIVHQNQEIVGKIYRVRREGKVLSVSLKRVSKKEEERKREEQRKLRRTFTIFNELGEKLGLSQAELIELLGKPLLKYFKTVFEGLKEILMEGKDLLRELETPEEYIDDIYSTLQSSIKISKRELKKEIIVETLAPNGIEKIKSAMREAQNLSPQNISIKYLSAPRYKVNIKAFRWKDASKRFRKFKTRLENEMGKIPSKWRTRVKVKEDGE